MTTQDIFDQLNSAGIQHTGSLRIVGDDLSIVSMESPSITAAKLRAAGFNGVECVTDFEYGTPVTIAYFAPKAQDSAQ